jgi:NADH-quinone oxidoreductase subunit C
LNIQQIHALLSERFGGAIGEWTEPEAGDGSIRVRPEVLHEVCRFLRDEPRLGFDYLRLLSAVDWTEHFSTVYHLYSLTQDHEVILRTDLDRADPRVASVADLWPTADWHEREAYDLMGIQFEGHPALTRIFMPDDWEGFPLRKDYTSPEEYHGIPNG